MLLVGGLAILAELFGGGTPTNGPNWGYDGDGACVGPAAPVSQPVAAFGAWSADQITNAASIITTGYAMSTQGVTCRDQEIALMTAITESSLTNLSTGTDDSVGLFQQRPSQGWGTSDQLQDPNYAATQFYTALLKVTNRTGMKPGAEAQAVQNSAYPDRYADHWSDAGGVMQWLTKAGSANPTNDEGLGQVINQVCGGYKADPTADQSLATGCPQAIDTGSLIALTAQTMMAWGGNWTFQGGLGDVSDLSQDIAFQFATTHGVDNLGWVRAVIYQATTTDIGADWYNKGVSTDWFDPIPIQKAQPGDVYIDPKNIDSTVAVSLREGNTTGIIVQAVTTGANTGTLTVDTSPLPVAANGVTDTGRTRQTTVDYSADDTTVVYRFKGGAGWDWPVPQGTPITSGFGWRSYPIAEFHAGYDLAGPGAWAPHTIPLHALHAGTVVSIIPGTDSTVGWITVDMHNGATYSYLHEYAEDNQVTVGQNVTAGQVLSFAGCSGSATGYCTGVHLHLQIEVNGTPVDPDEWLAENNTGIHY